MRTSLTLLIGGLAAVSACSGTDGTSPSASNTVMFAASPSPIIGAPGDLITTPPRVQVAVSPSEKPLAGAKVTFSFSDGRASDYSTTTNAMGEASLDNLHIDTRPGQYNIVASVAGGASVTFLAVSAGGKAIATYDLHAVGGIPGPPFFADGEPWNITSAHIQLFDDGSYRVGEDSNGSTGWGSREPYITRNDGSLEFYVDASWNSQFAGYSAHNYLIGVGLLNGDSMRVVYQSYLVREYEDYSRAK